MPFGSRQKGRELPRAGQNGLVFVTSLALASAAHAGAIWWLVASGVIEGAGGRFGEGAVPLTIEVDIVEAAPTKEQDGGEARQAGSDGQPSPPSIAQDSARARRAESRAPPRPEREADVREPSRETFAAATSVIATPETSTAPEAVPPSPPSDPRPEPPIEVALVPQPANPAPSQKHDDAKADADRAASLPASPGGATSKASLARPGTAGVAAASPGEIRSFQRQLSARLKAYRPGGLLARGRPLTGTVLVAFRVSREGALEHAGVRASSGDARLDEAALAAIRRAAPFPAPPPGMPARDLEILVPFQFE
jgi:protein TonB